MSQSEVQQGHLKTAAVDVARVWTLQKHCCDRHIKPQWCTPVCGCGHGARGQTDELSAGHCEDIGRQFYAYLSVTESA